jgi:hypothetical protein
MKQLLITSILFLIVMFNSLAQEKSWSGPSADFSHGKLKVSDNGRFLVYEDGTPFYYCFTV